MNEHAKNLRRTRADMLGTDDEAHYLECQKAADYIDRGVNMKSNIVKRLRNQKYNATIEEIYADSMEAADLIEGLRAALKDIVGADHCIGGDYCPHCLARAALEDKDE
jgi:selenocysteine lyase/cysteine desulfurase